MSRSKSQRSSNLEDKKSTPRTEFLKEPNNERPSSAQSSNSLGSSTSIYYYFLNELRQNYKKDRYDRVMCSGERQWRSMTHLNPAYDLSQADIHRRSKYKSAWNNSKSVELRRSLSLCERFIFYYKCPACGHCKHFRKRSYSTFTSDPSSPELSSQSSSSSSQQKKKKKSM